MTAEPATDSKKDALDEERRKRRGQAWERDLRLWSGLVLMVFLAMHLLNHALGVFGLEAMEQVQEWRLQIWRTWPGQIALYGSALVHTVLTLKRMAGRRTFRMPRDEALQIVLGLVIPLLLVDHVAGTRIVNAMFGTDDSYAPVLQRLYTGRPLVQTALVLVAWGHGCVGVYHAYRWRKWFRNFSTPLLVLAILTPVLALAGFASAGREVVLLHLPARNLETDVLAALHAAVQKINLAFAAALAITVLVVVARAIQRRRSGFFAIRYTGHGALRMSRGTSVLETSRINGIPHPSRCGGRARCATCRVLVISSEGPLPAPGKAERALLTRIDAPPQVRLGCQLRPQSNISVQVLLPFLASLDHPDAAGDAFRWGVEHTITVLFVNMRGFNLLAQRQYPQDVVLLLNRFTAEMTQAVDAHQGRVNTYLTDGLMAIFGLDGAKDAGSGNAIATAQAMLKVIQQLDREMADVLQIPLRIGIGIHTGPAIVARFGDTQRGQMVGALGETVSIADRLERASKAMLTDCLISAEALKASGLRLETSRQREIAIPGRDTPVVAFALKDVPPEAASVRSEGTVANRGALH